MNKFFREKYFLQNTDSLNNQHHGQGQKKRQDQYYSTGKNIPGPFIPMNQIHQPIVNKQVKQINLHRIFPHQS